MHITRESGKSAQMREKVVQSVRTQTGPAEKSVDEVKGLRAALKKAGRIGASALFAGSIAASFQSPAAAKEVQPRASIQKNTCTETSMVIEPFLQIPRNKPFTVIIYSGQGNSLYQVADVFNGSKFFTYVNQGPPEPSSIGNKNVFAFLPDLDNITLHYAGLFNTAFSREQIDNYSKGGIAGMLGGSPKNGLLHQWPSKQPYHTLEECKTSFASFPYMHFYFTVLLHVRNPNPLNYITFSLKAMTPIK